VRETILGAARDNVVGALFAEKNFWGETCDLSVSIKLAIDIRLRLMTGVADALCACSERMRLRGGNEGTTCGNGLISSVASTLEEGGGVTIGLNELPRKAPGERAEPVMKFPLQKVTRGPRDSRPILVHKSLSYALTELTCCEF
jgi:hypothetical protein